MAAPVVDADALELPEFSPVCEQRAHVGNPTPATHFVSAHLDEACFEGFRCTPCIDRAREEFAAWMARDGHVKCGYCKRLFHDIAEYVTVTPLRSPSP